MSQRTARLDELLREEISAIVARDIADPRIGFVTVTDVDVAPDLAHATVWVSVIGDAAARRASVRALGRAMPFVRHQLGALRLKRVPELHVREDDSAERGTRVLRILDELEQGEAVDEVAAETTAALPVPAPIRGVPEPRPKGGRHARKPRGAPRGR
ncbi:MAG: 30S ribosome-binding factor RbfA [Chloroflexota bacterium]